MYFSEANTRTVHQRQKKRPQETLSFGKERQRSLFSRCFHSNGGDGVGELEKETQRKKKSKNLGAITVFKLEKKKKSRTESWEREQWWLLERRYNCCYSLREVFPEPSE